MLAGSTEDGTGGGAGAAGCSADVNAGNTGNPRKRRRVSSRLQGATLGLQGGGMAGVSLSDAGDDGGGAAVGGMEGVQEAETQAPPPTAAPPPHASSSPASPATVDVLAGGGPGTAAEAPTTTVEGTSSGGAAAAEAGDEEADEEEGQGCARSGCECRALKHAHVSAELLKSLPPGAHVVAHHRFNVPSGATSVDLLVFVQGDPSYLCVSPGRHLYLHNEIVLCPVGGTSLLLSTGTAVLCKTAAGARKEKLIYAGTETRQSTDQTSQAHKSFKVVIFDPKAAEDKKFMALDGTDDRLATLAPLGRVPRNARVNLEALVAHLETHWYTRDDARDWASSQAGPLAPLVPLVKINPPPPGCEACEKLTTELAAARAEHTDTKAALGAAKGEIKTLEKKAKARPSSTRGARATAAQKKKLDEAHAVNEGLQRRVRALEARVQELEEESEDDEDDEGAEDLAAQLQAKQEALLVAVTNCANATQAATAARAELAAVGVQRAHWRDQYIRAVRKYNALRGHITNTVRPIAAALAQTQGVTIDPAFAGFDHGGYPVLDVNLN